ncbi:MAG: AAA domain-containing protein, partial [Ferruginibacter sp.]
LDGRTGEFRLFAPDFPDWIEDAGVGIKLAPDQRTTEVLKKALKAVEKNNTLFPLFEQLHDGNSIPINNVSTFSGNIEYFNTRLNDSQHKAIEAILSNESIAIVHGPPGTGKTTTLLEAIYQLTQKGQKVLVAAPSNTAVDHITKGLLQYGINVLRVGNSSKANADVFAHTPEGKLSNSKDQKEIKALKIRAEEFRKMALKYKRSFGKAEREQRNLLFKEVKAIRTEIKKMQAYNEDKLFAEATVITGTPIALYDAELQHMHFQTLFIDEAGQCLEPMAWSIFPLADKYVLGGDHLQLPPTVLSETALKLGYNRSILEIAVARCNTVHLLNTQYRMQESIAGFSSGYFYKGLLQTAAYLKGTAKQIYFIDTAGSGFQEIQGKDGMSLQNEGELTLIQKLIETENINLQTTALISPYAGQVAAAKEIFGPTLRISTIDSFQGQEQDTILLSLVRSNDDGDIGFLKDYRRMNVAITRAKKQLFVIGDSASIGADGFYNAFLTYVEQHGHYKTVWEFDLL